jgi:hypothetical protein
VKEINAAQFLRGMISSQTGSSLSIFLGYEWEEKISGVKYCWERSLLQC